VIANVRPPEIPMQTLLAGLASIHVLIALVALSGSSRTPLAAASVAPELVKPAATRPSGLRPADDAVTDAATGLPTRVVHEASGVTLVLMPAGEGAIKPHRM